uniref:Putative secreted protein n=1 Tax=Phlebotomus kandelakii TaxID=1109342 RepID=A0A6B2EAY9_9DIPT
MWQKLQKMIIDQLCVWVTVVLVVCGTTPGGCLVIPQARFEVLHPRGLRVSIPDIAGIKLFSFHGVVNEEIQLNQQGTIHGEVTKAINGRWTFTNSRVTVKGDDIINYWIYVQFNNLGYHVENKQLLMEASNVTLEDESECSCCTPIHHHYHYHYYNLPEDRNSGSNDSLQHQNHQEDERLTETVTNLEHEINRTVDKLEYFNAQINPLYEELRMLQDMVDYVQKRVENSTSSNELLLIGSFPAQIPSLIDYLDSFMRERLAIMDISKKIVTAQHLAENQIVFQVFSTNDKHLLLRIAREKKLLEEAGYILTNFSSDP